MYLLAAAIINIIEIEIDDNDNEELSEGVHEAAVCKQ